MCGSFLPNSSKTSKMPHTRNIESNSKTALILAKALSFSMEFPSSSNLKCKYTLFTNCDSAGFGLAPYVLQVKPIEIALFKDTKKQVFKSYDLSIAGMSFNHLKKAGGSKDHSCCNELTYRDTFVPLKRFA
jgi:hypothetical protein